MEIANVTLTGMLGITALLFWALYGHWIIPPVLTAIVLTVFTSTTLLLWSLTAIHPVTIAWLLVSCWVLALGYHLGMTAAGVGKSGGKGWGRRVHFAPMSAPGPQRGIALIWPRRFFLFCFLCGMVAHLLTMAGEQVEMGRLASIEGVVSLGREMALKRYYDDYSPPLAARLLGSLSLTGLLVAGVTMAMPSARPLRPYAALPFVALLFGALIHAARSGFFMGCVMFFSSYVVTAGYLGFTRSFFRRLGLGFVQFQRGGTLDTEGVSEAGTIVRDSILGALASFDRWFIAADGSTMRGGFYTFGGVFTLLGMGARVAGVYVDTVDVGATTTNIFTAMRGLIADFSLPGALIALFLFGGLWGYSFTRVRQGSLPHWIIASMGYGTLLYGFIVSLLTYNTVILAWLLAYGYLMLPRSRAFLLRYVLPLPSGLAAVTPVRKTRRG
jgi:hypothetical protein